MRVEGGKQSDRQIWGQTSEDGRKNEDGARSEDWWTDEEESWNDDGGGDGLGA